MEIRVRNIGAQIKEAARVLALLTLLAVGAFIVYRLLIYAKPSEESTLAHERMERPTVMQKSENLDTDNDGLKDWEERLWGTSVSVADSDEDGTSDGAEALQGRDPRIAGPNDALSSPVKSAERNDSRYVPRTFVPTVEKSEPVEVTGAGTVQEEVDAASKLKVFGNDLGRILIEAGRDTEQVSAFLNSTVGKTKMTAAIRKGLRDLEHKYRAVGDAIAAVEAPNGAKGFTDAFSASYLSYAAALGLMADTEEGSYYEERAVRAYSDAVLSVARAFIDNGNFFSDNGVMFSLDEPGFIFMFPKGITVY